jgi:hypothetical protein
MSISPSILSSNSKKNKKNNKKFAPVIVEKEFFNYGEAVLESSSSLSVAGLSVAGLSVAGLSVAGLSVASLPEEKIINDIIQEVIEDIEEKEEKEKEIESLPVASLPDSNLLESLPVAGLPDSNLLESLPVAGLPVAGLPDSNLLESLPVAGLPDSNLLESLPVTCLEKSINIEDVKKLDDIVEEKDITPLEISEVDLLSDESIDKDIKIKDKKKVIPKGLINNLLIMFGFCKN